MEKLRKNHKFLSLSGNLRQLCQPLREIHIQKFTYLKLFRDGGEINISSESEWIKDYYQLGLYQSSNFVKAIADNKKLELGFQFWAALEKVPVLEHGLKKFNSAFGLTYTQEESDGVAFYFFSTEQKYQSLLSFYLSNLDLFEKFIAYFHVKMKDDLKACESHKIWLPKSFSTEEIILFKNQELRENFLFSLQKKGMENINLLKKEFMILTQREKDCLNLLLDEPSARAIGKRLNISPRTVETHLERVKEKLQCKNRQELILKLIQKF